MDQLIEDYAELERRIAVLEFDIQTLRTSTSHVISERQACLAELAALSDRLHSRSRNP